MPANFYTVIGVYTQPEYQRFAEGFAAYSAEEAEVRAHEYVIREHGHHGGELIVAGVALGEIEMVDIHTDGIVE
jgi:hypothetical protein